MSEELKANAALLTEAIDALTSCDDVDYRIDMMLAYRPEIVSTLRALLSLLTAAEARAEAAEARVGELEDRLDGTQCDLDGALDVLWRRGDDEARQWILLNYLRDFEGRATPEQLAKLDAEREALGLPSRTSIQDAP